MTERELPAPSVDAESAPFYAAAREGRFLLRRCTACGEAHWPPREMCPFCFGSTSWTEASGDGVIYSCSVMPRATPPYAIAYVTLAEGPAMLTDLVECDFGALRIGQRVKLVFRPSAPDGPPVPCFRPA